MYNWPSPHVKTSTPTQSDGRGNSVRLCKRSMTHGSFGHGRSPYTVCHYFITFHSFLFLQNRNFPQSRFNKSFCESSFCICVLNDYGAFVIEEEN
ncbi:hypothetical protein AVEN_203742-1 [Araneus ventricosus]|uniref:Uncharacterized protein n=1 Tax=Araneus ventricosus TaxID=182803 RepID=A0A4Y2U6F3_ARAVE|nr:hypothetical protein AVEN_203742-1 [Araneus ventricosus]